MRDRVGRFFGLHVWALALVLVVVVPVAQFLASVAGAVAGRVA